MGSPNYVSIFKIDGVPILPPLMTEEKREEMRNYKDLAAAIEMKLKLERETSMFCISSPRKIDTDQESDVTTTTFDNEYLRVSNMLKAPVETTKEEEEKIENEKDFLRHLGRSDLFICDVTSNTLMIPSFENQHNITQLNDLPTNQNQSKAENKTEHESIDAELLKNSTDIQTKLREVTSKVPSISIEPSSPVKECKRKHQLLNRDRIWFSVQNKNTRENRIPPRRASTSPSLNNCENHPKLIRSNSFTLDSPSDALIEHIVKCKREELQKSVRKMNSETSDRNCIKFDNLQKEKLKIESKTESSQSLRFKNKKSPYDVKPSVKNSKPIRKAKVSLSKTPSITSSRRNTRSPVIDRKSPCLIETTNNDQDNFKHIKELIEEVENKHRFKLKELLEKQQEEQRIMQDNFEKQQKLLLEKFTSSIIRNTSANEIKSAWTEEINALHYSSDVLGIDSSQSICIADTVNNKFESNSSSPKCANSNASSLKSSPRRLFSVETSPITKKLFGNLSARKREEAATKINAHVRGYLVRRLFQTEFVQRIVQTIRDTLLFVIDLHIETRDDDSEENIKLKARLLQQLTSACQNLHKTFFKYSIKERMSIIAKDREILRRKSDKYQRTPRKVF